MMHGIPLSLVDGKKKLGEYVLAVAALDQRNESGAGAYGDSII